MNTGKCFTEVCIGTVHELLQMICLNVDLLTALVTIHQSEFFCRFHADNHCGVQQHNARCLPPRAVEHSWWIHVSRHTEWVPWSGNYTPSLSACPPRWTTASTVLLTICVRICDTLFFCCNFSYVPLPAISRRRHSVFGLSLYIPDHIVKVLWTW